VVFEHGIGGSQDLPISLPLALAGGAAALAVSFVVLALAWRRPRYDAATQGRPLPGPVARFADSRALAVTLRTVGLLFTAYVVWAAVAGQDNGANPTFGVVYVLLWVGLVPASVLLGPFYRAVNPVRTVHRLLSRLSGGDPAEGVLHLPGRVGLWPASLGLLAFVWMELVSPDATFLWTVRLWFAAYFAIVLVGASLFGDRWIAAADPFEAFSTLVGRLSPFGRRADGVLVVRSPLCNLDGTPEQAGLTATVAVLVGSTAWDSFQDSLGWQRFSLRVDVSPVLLDTAGLVGLCLVVGGLFAGATMLMTPVDGVARREMPNLFAHSVVPIVVGDMTAHYLSYFVEVGQQTVAYLSDPLVDGSDYLGTRDLQVSYWLSLHPTLLANLKVLAIVGGHVLGVVAAHDRAMRLLPRRHQLTGQLPLLAVMVVYTLGGLVLLLTV
jgi:hypothetical protein